MFLNLNTLLFSFLTIRICIDCCYQLQLSTYFSHLLLGKRSERELHETMSSQVWEVWMVDAPRAKVLSNKVVGS